MANYMKVHVHVLIYLHVESIVLAITIGTMCALTETRFHFNCDTAMLIVTGAVANG